MRFVKNNVNGFLLFLLISILVFAVAYNHFQEVDHQEVFLEKERLQARIVGLESNLSAQEERLRSVFNELEQQLQDSVKFENLYGEVTDERDTLRSDLADLTSEYERERSSRLSAEATVRDLQASLASVTAENANLRSRLNSCRDDLDRCEDRLAVCADG